MTTTTELKLLVDQPCFSGKERVLYSTDFYEGQWYCPNESHQYDALDDKEQWDGYGMPVTGTLYKNDKRIASIDYDEQLDELEIIFDPNEMDGCEFVATQYFNKFECSHSLFVEDYEDGSRRCKYFMINDPMIGMLRLFDEVSREAFKTANPEAYILEDQPQVLIAKDSLDYIDECQEIAARRSKIQHKRIMGYKQGINTLIQKLSDLRAAHFLTPEFPHELIQEIKSELFELL